MEKKQWLPLLACTLLLSGCGSIFEREYSYSAPFSYNIRHEAGDATEVSNYNMLKSALIDLINNHEESGAFRFSRYNGSVAEDLSEACLEIRTTNPLGAYAVDTLAYDTSRIVSYYTADIHVTYKKTAEEIRDIVGIGNLQELGEALRAAVEAGEKHCVLRVYSQQVNEEYISDLIQSLHLEDPVGVVMEPQVEISSYPVEGINRIYDIHLGYGVDAARLAEMSEKTAEQVSTLTRGMTAESQPKLALKCADSLFALLKTDASGSFPETAYGALVDNSADSMGVALAYKALCDALGIECLVVQGNIGSMGAAEEHCWNIIRLEGDYYHVDVSAFVWDRAGAFLLTDDSLWGIYLWDTEAYPACTGALRFDDLLPPPPPETAAPAVTARPTHPSTPIYTPLPPAEGQYIPRESMPPEETEAPEDTGEPGESPTPQETDAPEPTAEPYIPVAPTESAAPAPEPTGEPPAPSEEPE